MNIVHVDTAAGWRGGQNQVLLSAQGMAERGHRVTLACRAGGALERRARDAGLDVRPLSFRGDFAPLAIVGLARVCRQVRPDVMQLHDPHAVATGLFAGLLAPGGATVATRRVDFPLRGPLSGRKYRACAGVIGVSRPIVELLASAGLDRDRLHLVHEGVRERPAVPGGREALEAMGVRPGALVIGTVAALVDHKDHATLIEAARLLRSRCDGVQFVIVGDGELRPALEATVSRLGLQGTVLFAGFRSDVDRLLPAFDVFCLSSHMEGLGTSLLDALSFGVPVVATTAGGIPDAIGDGRSGRLVSPRDPGALAEALLDVATDEPCRRAYARAGLDRFRRLFSAERMVDETLRVFGGLL